MSCNPAITWYDRENISTNAVAMSLIESEQPQNEELPHSVYGIVSLNLALCSIILPFVLLVISTAFGLDSEIVEAVFALGLVCMVFAGIVAFTLGVIGVCQSRTRKVFSVLGITFASLPLMFAFFFIVIGIIVGFIAGIQRYW